MHIVIFIISRKVQEKNRIFGKKSLLFGTECAIIIIKVFEEEPEKKLQARCLFKKFLPSYLPYDI